MGQAGWRLSSRRGEMVAGKALERESKGAGRGWSEKGEGVLYMEGERFSKQDSGG